MTLYMLEDHAPHLSEDVWVASDANVIGQVTLGARCSVWFGATLRGDNEKITLGEGCNVQENVVIHTDPGFSVQVGDGCTIGHKALLHGCTVAENVLIGMGATVLNGARIGRNCLIGAGALVTEGKDIPEGSLVVGAPGRVVRALSEEEIDRLRAAAVEYQRKARRYRNGLRQI